MSGSITATTTGTTTGTTAGTTGVAARSGAKLSADLGTFLTLLTTQLRNQDPTKPMDTEALTQQLTQFASIEQQIQGNRTLEQLLGLQQAGQLSGSAALVGRRVTMESEVLPLQSGQAEVVLPAAGRAGRAVVELRDAAGNVLRRETVALGAGPASWRWDGRDAGGQQWPDGAYRVSVTGRAEDGTDVPLASVIAGRVTGSARIGGELMLRLGPAAIPFDRLRELPGS
jgi:flagellar basal-body rod modification protein FlgD